MPIRTRPAIVLILLSTAGILLSCRQKPQVPEAGVSFQLNQERHQRIRDVRYQLFLDIPAQKSGRIEGRIDIGFSLTNGGMPLVLDFSAKDGIVKDVYANDESVAFEFQNGHIVVDEDELTEGPQKISIGFTAGDQSLNRNDDYLYTLFVPDRASTCFPLFDQPNIKAKYTLQLRVPAGWKAVSNGALTEETRDQEKITYAFGETKPISSYLFAFATGAFKSMSQEADNRPMTMYYRETDSTKVAKNKDEIFRLHGQSLAWLEQYTAIGYPFGKFDFVLIPSFQYGGMEHPGSIFYNESSLFLDDNASINRKMGRASLIAHETAHMWFGDLVTMDWFNDVWMKEVFANFMAAKIVQPSFPEIDHDLRFLLSHYPGAYSVDRTKGANPIIQPLDNLKNAGTMYGPIIYQKAPIVMRHLEKMIGDTTMQESLREYLTTYQFGNAVWDDLVKIIDGRTPDSIARWSEVWVKTAGMPEYEWKPEADRQRLVQTEDHAGRYWTQPITVAGQDPSADKTVTDLRTQPVVLEAGATALANPDGTSYGYFHLTPSVVTWLVERYPVEGRGPAFRAAMLMNLWESMLHGSSPEPAELLDHFHKFLGKETNPLIIDYILSQYETLWWMFLTPDVRQSYQQEAERMLWRLLEKTGDKGMKASYFRAYRSIALSPEALSRLENIWTGKLEVKDLSLPEDDRIALAYELALKISDRQEEILSKQLEQTLNPDRKDKLRFVMPALSNDEKTRDTFFESLKLEANREHEPWVLEALGFLHHPLREQSSEKYIMPSLELLQEIQLTGDIFFPQRWLNTTFEGHSGDAALRTVNRFIDDQPDYPPYLKNKILQAADMTERAAHWKRNAARQ